MDGGTYKMAELEVVHFGETSKMAELDVGHLPLPPKSRPAPAPFFSRGLVPSCFSGRE